MLDTCNDFARHRILIKDCNVTVVWDGRSYEDRFPSVLQLIKDSVAYKCPFTHPFEFCLDTNDAPPDHRYPFISSTGVPQRPYAHPAPDFVSFWVLWVHVLDSLMKTQLRFFAAPITIRPYVT